MPAIPFTVILSTYNHERYVRAAIESVQAQTVPVDQVVYFDDGSTDATRAVAREAWGDDPRVEWLDRCDENHGLVPRLTAAHARVRAGYVIGLSGDDLLCPRAVEIHRDVVARTGTHWSIAGVQVTDEARRPIHRVDPPSDLLATGRNLFDALMMGEPWLPGQGWAYSIDIFHEVGGYDPRLRLVDDLVLGLRLALATSPELSTDVVGLQRRIPGVSMTVSEKHAVTISHDIARTALMFARRRPALALPLASWHYAVASYAALREGSYGTALRDAALSAALWPNPLGRPVRQALTRASRLVTR